MIQFGIKYNGAVYLARASDCFPMPDAGNVLSNAGVWTPKYAKNTILSYGGDIPELNLLRFNKDFIKERDMKNGKLDVYFAYHNVYKEFVNMLLERKMYGNDEPFEKIGASILIAKDDVLLHIDEYGFIKPIEESIVTEEHFIQGRAILYTQDKTLDPIYRILKTFDMIVQDEYQYPIIIKSTANPKKTLIFNEIKARSYIKAYEKGHKN